MMNERLRNMAAMSCRVDRLARSRPTSAVDFQKLHKQFSPAQHLENLYPPFGIHTIRRTNFTLTRIPAYRMGHFLSFRCGNYDHFAGKQQ